MNHQQKGIKMNVFEDLIEELKEENLLEETVIDLRKANDRPLQPASPTPAVPHLFSESANFLASDLISNEIDADEDAVASAPEIHETGSPVDEREFYRKRAMDEVSSLQMVEHVLSGIEREHMKMTPVAFDDLNVKKALHKFLQVSADISSNEYSEAELHLMQETENWFSALAKRDANISVANVRRFCENSKPILSSQALMALARFYRNSPYSEPVRGKFDFVMTRLFSREIGEERRKLLFGRSEMIGHIRTLYSNWSSLALFPSGENADGVSQAVNTFHQFAAESLASETFDSLISSDFFNRIRLFKEETNEMFFASEVTAAAIECNVNIGNRFVDLIRKESRSVSLDEIDSKYGFTYDTVVSSAASKTLFLVELFKDEKRGQEDAVLDSEPVDSQPVQPVRFERAPVEEPSGFRLFSLNKWLVALTIIVLIASAGIYFWSENQAVKQGDVAAASTVELSDPDLRQHLRLARTSSETLYGVAQPSWDAQSQDEQKELLKKAFAFAQSIKMKRVNILNNKGRTIGYASADRVEVLGPQ